ncbi:MAG: DUF1934 domain-containing protein [Mogibacterium sp.]|nr:DUF1934 domain-containing protein [Mogibacterium sp.]
MKKNVNLKITSKQYVENLKPSGEAFLRELEIEDSLEIMTEGTLYSKNNARYISYDEALDVGLEDAHTLVKLDGKSVRIRRYCGENEDDSMDMTLEPGVLNITRYQVPQVVSLDLEVYTNKLEDKLNEDGYGTVSVDYKIKFDKFYSRRNILEIEVMPS